MTATRPAHGPLNGSTTRRGRAPAVEVTRQPDGWLLVRRPFTVPDGADPLEVHADWAGCVKLAEAGAAVEQRFEYFLGGPTAGADDALDDEAAAQREELAGEL